MTQADAATCRSACRRCRLMTGGRASSLISSRTFDRSAPLQLLEWLCHRYGFGTYFHHIRGPARSRRTTRQSQEVRDRLIQAMQSAEGRDLHGRDDHQPFDDLGAGAGAPDARGSPVWRTTRSCSSSGGTIGPEVLEEVVPTGCSWPVCRTWTASCSGTATTSSGRGASIHVWLTWHDARNANLMILLSYILLGHRDWHGAEVKLFGGVPAAGDQGEGGRDPPDDLGRSAPHQREERHDHPDR